jgi:putative mRNA 3-end processing factor
MSAPFSWIRPEPQGIYIAPADTWVDPSRAVPRALVTHGHADHARGGHGETIATPATLAIMELRYNTRDGAAPAEYGESVAIGGGVRATTGDYKRAPDPTAAPFAVTPCDIFITEATFGLPVFSHPPIAEEITKLLISLDANPGSCILVGAYALGKAQRVIAELRASGHHDAIWLHGAMEAMCRLYEEHGAMLGDLRLVSDAPSKEAMRGHIVIAPPAALADRWSRRLPDPVTAMASGWMRVRGRARQRGVELPLVISDHADWNELTATIAEVNPHETWITHGREEALLRWCALNQRRARALALVGREDEDE